MPSILSGVDLSDPCAVYPKLEEALLKLVAGERVARVRFGEDDVTFTDTSSGELRREIARLKGECVRNQTGRPARRAFRAGFRC